MSAARQLGLAALALGVAAPFAGDPQRMLRAEIDIDELADIVAREEDHVTALELAAWIRQRKPGLRVIDVRGAQASEDARIPGAEPHSITAIGRSLFSADEVVVLYSEAGAHAAQAWVFLRARGLRNVYFLRGGWQEWRDDVMHPVLPAAASPRMRQQFATIAELSRYFGGSPGVGVEGEARADGGSHKPEPVRRPRMGC